MGMVQTYKSTNYFGWPIEIDVELGCGWGEIRTKIPEDYLRPLWSRSCGDREPADISWFVDKFHGDVVLKESRFSPESSNGADVVLAFVRTGYFEVPLGDDWEVVP